MHGQVCLNLTPYFLSIVCRGHPLVPNGVQPSTAVNFYPDLINIIYHVSAFYIAQLSISFLYLWPPLWNSVTPISSHKPSMLGVFGWWISASSGERISTIGRFSRFDTILDHGIQTDTMLSHLRIEWRG